jgi:hypothetical protein
VSPLRSRLVLGVLAAATASSPVLAQTVPPPPPTRPAPPPASPGPAAPAPATPAITPAAEVAAADKALRIKDWAGALAHDQAALAGPLDPKLQLHAQLGAAEALFQLGRAAEAYDAYDEIQRSAGTKLVGGDKAVVVNRLKDLATKTGALSLHVEEPGADVQLDGKALGASPLALLTRVAAGSHEVRVTKAGFVPFVSHIDVAPDVKATVDVALVRAATTGHVVVQAPGGESLRVIVDGVDRGATPWEGDLPAGAHEISGRSSSATVAPQGVMVTAGEREQVTLVTTATAAHVQIRTSDGKGLVYLDGVVKGEGAFEGDTAPGPHSAVVTREGYERYEKAFTLGPRETMAETVTLHPTAAAAAAAAGPVAERAFQGVYGAFGFGGLFGVSGQGTDLETTCNELGASSCNTPKAIGGGAFGYVGYTWDPVGFELFLAGEGDTAQQTANFNGSAPQFSSLIGQEKFTYIRFGGLAALRARATASFGSVLRGTLAGGVGLSIKELTMARQATASGTTGRDLYVPSPAFVQYVSPALTLEASLELRVTPTVAFSLGLLLWADNASIAGTNDVAASPGRELYAKSGAPEPIETPQYHLATGPQVFLGPQLGMLFGP